MEENPTPIQHPFDSPITQEKHINWLKVFIVIGIFIFILVTGVAIGAFFLFNNHESHDYSESRSITVENSPLITQEPLQNNPPKKISFEELVNKVCTDYEYDYRFNAEELFLKLAEDNSFLYGICERLEGSGLLLNFIDDSEEYKTIFVWVTEDSLSQSDPIKDKLTINSSTGLSDISITTKLIPWDVHRYYVALTGVRYHRLSDGTLFKYRISKDISGRDSQKLLNFLKEQDFSKDKSVDQIDKKVLYDYFKNEIETRSNFVYGGKSAKDTIEYILNSFSLNTQYFKNN